MVLFDPVEPVWSGLRVRVRVSLQRDPKYQFSDSTEIRLANSSTKYSCNSVTGSHTSQSSISEIFFPVFI